MKYFLAIVILGGLAIWGFAVQPGGDDQPGKPQYRLAKAARGDIVKVVSASGAVRAVVTVNVGAQISGMISALEADFNSPVSEGQVIARIDQAPFQARLAQAEAERDVALASHEKQISTLREFEAEEEGRKAVLSQAQAEVDRQKQLAARGSATERSVETAEAQLAEAAASAAAASARIASQRAQIILAKAQIAEREAVIRQRTLDLEYTLIRSPVDGVVISRNVDVGQIVAASLEAPILFQIAQDLSLMQLTISIDEADIGRIAIGQIVEFSVDAYPSQRFLGRVSQIRLAGRTISNVVTYSVIVDFANADHRLLPGMTADASIVVQQRENVLSVPTAAFYFTPPNVTRGNDWNVWVPGENGAPIERSVEFGIYDDEQTEIISGLTEGEPVIIGLEQAPVEDRFRWPSLGL